MKSDLVGVGEDSDKCRELHESLLPGQMSTRALKSLARGAPTPSQVVMQSEGWGDHKPPLSEGGGLRQSGSYAGDQEASSQ